MKKNLWSLLLLCFFVVLTSCEKNDDNDPGDDQPKENPIEFLVANQGAFSQTRASISAVYRTGEVKNNIFTEKNNRPLGSVAQFVTLIGDKIYVPLNNSKKIEIFDQNDFAAVATIEINKTKCVPQYIEIISDTEAVMSDLSNSVLYVIDTKEYKLKKEVSFTSASSTGQMIKANNKLYLKTQGKITVFSLPALNEEKTIDVSVAGDSKMVLDKDGNIWALTLANLKYIDPKTDDVIKTLPIPQSLSISTFGARLDIDVSKSKLFFNGTKEETEGIYSVSTGDSQISDTPLFNYSDKVQVLFNMNLAKDNTILIADAGDYTTAGKVVRFTQDGKLINTYNVGIIPCCFYFF